MSPRYVSNSGLDFALARTENVKFTMDGEARLSSRNLLPDPGFKEFGPSGEPRFWILSGPRNVVARNVYIAPKGTPEIRQNFTPLPVGSSSYTQSLALDMNGPSLPPRRTPGEDLNTARAAYVRAVSGSDRGYPAGLYPVSYAWVVGSLYQPRMRNLTNPAPPIWVSLAEGQSYELPLPQERAEGALGLAILQGLPGGEFSELYVQEIIDIRSYIPASRVMDGPLKLGMRAPATNETYIGAFMDWRRPSIQRTAGVRTLLPMNARCSYRFRTDLGVSASQGYTDVSIPREYPRQALRFFFPRLHPRVIAVIPQVQAPSSEWYDLDYGLRGGDVPIIPGWGWRPYFFTDDAEKSTELVRYNSGERSTVDETGIPGPDSPLEDARTFGLARLSPGDYGARTTDVYASAEGSAAEDVESPPSGQSVVSVGTNQDIAVDFREDAEAGNIIPNADLSERAKIGGPLGYTFPYAPSANLTVTAERSVVYFDDSTSRTTVEDIFVRERFRVSEIATYTFRAALKLERSSGGAVQVSVFFHDAFGAQVDARSVFSTSGDADEQITCGPAGSGADVQWPAGTRFASYVVRLRGNVTARNIAGRAVHIGMFRGTVAPCKRVGANPVPAEEPEDEPYPTGGYMAIVEDPEWAGGKGNGLEFYGSYLTRRQRRYFAHGHRVPLTPNRVYTISGEYSHASVLAGTEVLAMSVRNAASQVTQALDPALYSEAGGEGAGTFSATFVTGPEAGYLEFGPSDIGGGLIRVWGMQLEYGEIATTWTDAHAPAGEIAATFRTTTPGLSHRKALAKRLYGIEKLLDAGAAADLPDGTDVTVSVRSRREGGEWSAHVSSVEELETTEEVEVLATLTTNALSVTPELSEISLSAKPPRPVLLREDGTEYDGGVLVEGMPATGYGENTESTPRADGSRRTLELYEPPRELTGLTLKALTDKGAHQLMYDASHGSRTFTIEGHGLRRLVRILRVVMVPSRSEIIGGGLARHEATDISAEVLDEEPLENSLETEVLV